MELVTSQLPSGGSTYNFPTVRIEPLTFQSIFHYSEGRPENSFARLIHDINYLKKDDPNIGSILLTDIDFLIFMKKSITISSKMKFRTSYKCPTCNTPGSLELALDEVEFELLGEELKRDIVITLRNKKYTLGVPTVDEFLKVAGNYVRSKVITDLDTVKILSLIKEYERRPNDVEFDVLNSIHEDITTLATIKDLYFNKLKPIHTFCPTCNKNTKPSERRHLVVLLEELALDPFRDVLENNPVVSNKVLSEQVR